MSSIHGHEVLHTMLGNDKGWTRSSLLKALADKYGENCLFHTCSASEMSADQLIDFLEAKGKFVETTDGFTTQASKICSH